MSSLPSMGRGTLVPWTDIQRAADGGGGVPPLSPSPHAPYETAGFIVKKED
jgi:hypothetical protein